MINFLMLAIGEKGNANVSKITLVSEKHTRFTWGGTQQSVIYAARKYFRTQTESRYS